MFSISRDILGDFFFLQKFYFLFSQYSAVHLSNGLPHFALQLFVLLVLIALQRSFKKTSSTFHPLSVNRPTTIVLKDRPATFHPVNINHPIPSFKKTDSPTKRPDVLSGYQKTVLHLFILQVLILLQPSFKKSSCNFSSCKY
jgi:hypothetical protein